MSKTFTYKEENKQGWLAAKKAKEYVDEFGKEKALDLCETMLHVAIGLKTDVSFWKQVKKLIQDYEYS